MVGVTRSMVAAAMMMMMTSTAFVASAPASSSSASQCLAGASIDQGLKYHANSTCGDRASYNQFKESLGRHWTYQKYRKLGSYRTVPNQKTVYCPVMQQSPADLHSPIATTGIDTVWLVENTADVPVVVGYLNEHGIEVSAKNPKISPPHSDASAILQPHHWMAVHTYEGHVFHVREYAGPDHIGDLWMQHRVGLIPIGEGVAGQLVCNLDDPEPIVKNTRAPEFKRTEPAVDRPCYTLEVGFRNMAGCPLHAYYVSTDSDPNSPATAKPTYSACQETFKFHLGVQDYTEDFMWAWQSTTKFEGSFVGHSFAFRLADDPSILVDRVTLQPSRVVSCPKREKGKDGTEIESRTVAEAVRDQVLQGAGDKDILDDLLFDPKMASYGHRTAGITSMMKEFIIANVTTKKSRYPDRGVGTNRTQVNRQSPLLDSRQLYVTPLGGIVSY